MGADIKYGITSNLTLDATVNPDFGQVEADPATLNLTAFETFLNEQRPFFLEGTGIFQFGDDPTESSIRAASGVHRSCPGSSPMQPPTSRAHRASSAPASSLAACPTALHSACLAQ